MQTTDFARALTPWLDGETCHATTTAPVLVVPLVLHTLFALADSDVGSDILDHILLIISFGVSGQTANMGATMALLAVPLVLHTLLVRLVCSISVSYTHLTLPTKA